MQETTPSVEIPQNKKKIKKGSWLDTLRFVVIALAIVIPIRIFIAEPFIVSGHSMDPTFQDNQYLIINRISYHVHDPHRGDVVIFRYPKNPSIYYIKRIIGLPGETVTISHGKTMITTVDNRNITLDESFITNKDKVEFDMTTKLGSTEYFVLGDNRPNSSDSRYWGPLDKKFIVGTPLISLFPLQRMGFEPGSHTFGQ